MPRFSLRFLLMIAAVLSLVTAGLVHNLLQASLQSESRQGEMIVVAARDIPGRSVLTPEMLKVLPVPAELVQPGAVKDIAQAVGVMSRVPIAAGEQVTERKLAIEGKMSGFADSIPRDKQAFTIGVNDVTGVAGFVKAGDYVDIVATFDKSIIGQDISGPLLQNILVLAANRNDNMEAGSKEKKDTEKMVSVTLAVSTQEASVLALAEEKGKIQLALRPLKSNADAMVVRAITPEDLLSNYYHAVANRVITNPVAEAAEVKAVFYPPSSVPSAPVAGGIKVIRGTKTETTLVN